MPIATALGPAGQKMTLSPVSKAPFLHLCTPADGPYWTIRSGTIPARRKVSVRQPDLRAHSNDL